MEHIYEYAWIIPFIPLPVPFLKGAGILFFFPTATKKIVVCEIFLVFCFLV